MKRQAASGTYSVPLAPLREGDFSITTTKIYDPLTGNGEQAQAEHNFPTIRFPTAG